jgi:hypothetical protein
MDIMVCTSCNKKLDLRRKKSFIYASYSLQSNSFLKNMFQKNRWVFCSTSCKIQGDKDWISGNFEKKHGSKALISKL